MRQENRVFAYTSDKSASAVARTVANAGGRQRKGGAARLTGMVDRDEKERAGTGWSVLDRHPHWEASDSISLANGGKG